MPILFSVAPLDADLGTRATLRFCSGDDPDLTGLDDARWWPGIARAPTLSYEVFDGNFETSVNVAAAAFVINLAALKKADANAPVYRWAGAQVQIYRGPAGGAWADFEHIFTGLVTDHRIENGDVRLTARVDSEVFEGEFLTEKYVGAGGASGNEDLKDKVKPALFGYAKNVEPVMINTVDNVFQVHGYGPIEDIVMVYERALEFGASVGDYATYAALVAANIDEGDWGTCLAEGMFRLGAPPYGLITADVKGDNSGGFHQTTAAVIERLCEIAEVDAARIDSVSLAAFATAVPYPVNLYQTTQVKLLDLVQQLARPCNAQASLSWLGKLQVTRFGTIATPPVMTLDAQGRQLPPVLENAELSVSPPYWRMEMHANRNWRVQTKDEIAFEDPEPVPVTVYRRYPLQPDTPSGNGIPSGWSLTPPGYSDPVIVNTFPQFGPVWASFALQLRDVTTDAGWSEPTLADSEYPQWTLISQNVGAKVQAATRGVKATADFNVLTDTLPYCFINRPVTGAFHLRCKVRGAVDRVAVGVVPYSPAVLNAEYNYGDVKDGFYNAQNDEFVVYDHTTGVAEPITGVFIFQDYEAGLDYTNPLFARMLDVPTAGCELEMIFNGETVEHYINGIHVRTHYVDNALEGQEFWAVFVPLSASAEIYDIVWARATQGRELDYRHDHVEGAVRRTTDQVGWEVYAPDMDSGSGAALIYSKLFTGGAYCSAKIAAFAAGTVLDTDTYNIMSLAEVGYFTFFADGTFEAAKASGSIEATGSWVAGDNFGMSVSKQTVPMGWGYYTRTQLLFIKNGETIATEKATLPASSSLEIELGAGGKLYDINFVPSAPSTGQSKGSGSSPTILSPIADTTATVAGGYIVVAETTDVPFNADNEDIVAGAQFRYTKTAGAALSFTPEAQMQFSSDSGGSWSNVGSPVTGAASTGTQQSLSLDVQQTVSGTGTRRYRLLVKNTVAGAYTVTTAGYLSAQWVG